MLETKQIGDKFGGVQRIKYQAGYYDPRGNWQGIGNEYDSENEVAGLVSFLNGGMHPTFSTLLRTQAEKVCNQIERLTTEIRNHK